MDGITPGATATFHDRFEWIAGYDMIDGGGLEARLGALIEAPGEATGAERRQAERLPVEIDAKLRELGNTGTETRVLNLSQTGFMAETEAEFAVGARVWLMLPGRERANAVVRWVEAGRIGAEFAEPIEVDPASPA